MFAQFKLYLFGTLVALAVFAGWGLYEAGYRAAEGDMAADVVHIQNAAIADAHRKSAAAAERVAKIERAYMEALSRAEEVRRELENLPDSGARFSDDELRVLERLHAIAGAGDTTRVPDPVQRPATAP